MKTGRKILRDGNPATYLDTNDLRCSLIVAERVAEHGPLNHEQTRVARQEFPMLLEARDSILAFLTYSQPAFQLAPSVVDVGTITEYGLTQKLSQNVRVF